MSDDVIYLDYNASTPCDPRVVEAMLPYLSDTFANPSSRHHRPGRDAFTALEQARSTVAHLLGATSATEIVLTSGATEANNLALTGTAEARTGHGRHIVTQVTEHPSVLEPLAHLRKTGCDVTEIGVDSDGLIRLDELSGALRDDTVLVSLMLANNETGVLQPVAQAAELATPPRPSAKWLWMSLPSTLICSPCPVTSSMRQRESAPSSYGVRDHHSA